MPVMATNLLFRRVLIFFGLIVAIFLLGALFRKADCAPQMQDTPAPPRVEQPAPQEVTPQKMLNTLTSICKGLDEDPEFPMNCVLVVDEANRPTMMTMFPNGTIGGAIWEELLKTLFIPFCLTEKALGNENALVSISLAAEKHYRVLVCATGQMTPWTPHELPTAPAGGETEI